MIQVATLVADRLIPILRDLESKPEALENRESPGELPLIDQILQVKEYIQCDEGSLAYEVLVAILEKIFIFNIWPLGSGPA